MKTLFNCHPACLFAAKLRTRVACVWLAYGASLLPAAAQEAADTYTPTRAGKGYWQLATDYVSQSTILRFYALNHHLVYEEVFPGQYIRLTNRNIRRIDQACERFIANKLVGEAVRPRLLGARENERYFPQETASSAVSAGVDTTAGLAMTLYRGITSFKLMFNNPLGNDVRIQVKDRTNHIVYQKIWRKVRQCNCPFDLSWLNNGTYTVEASNILEVCSRQIQLGSLTPFNVRMIKVPTGRFTSATSSISQSDQ
jgi:hypothetical protein